MVKMRRSKARKERGEPSGKRKWHGHSPGGGTLARVRLGKNTLAGAQGAR